MKTLRHILGLCALCGLLVSAPAYALGGGGFDSRANRCQRGIESRSRAFEEFEPFVEAREVDRVLSARAASVSPDS